MKRKWYRVMHFSIYWLCVEFFSAMNGTERNGTRSKITRIYPHNVLIRFVCIFINANYSTYSSEWYTVRIQTYLPIWNFWIDLDEIRRENFNVDLAKLKKKEKRIECHTAIEIRKYILQLHNMPPSFEHCSPFSRLIWNVQTSPVFMLLNWKHNFVFHFNQYNVITVNITKILDDKYCMHWIVSKVETELR